MCPSNRVAAIVLATLVCSAIAGRAKAGPASPDFVIRGDAQADPTIVEQPAPAPEPTGAPDPQAAPQSEPVMAAAAEPALIADGVDATPVASVQPSGGGLWHPGIDALSTSSLPMTAASTTDSLDGRDPQQAMVPLPTAAWTGLSTLLGLAVIRFARNFRQILN